MDTETPAPTDNPRPTRLFKWRAPLLVAASLLALYFAPQLPAVRGWLLTRVAGAVRTAGYRFDYSSSGGNPWGGLRLDGVALRGPGLDVTVDKLSLGYFLPALVTGKLPVSVTAAGVRGAVDGRDLKLPSGSGTQLLVTPVLRRLNLKDVSAELTGVPYTLPDFSVTSLQARPVGDGFRAEATLATREGEADVNGTLSLSPLRFTADVPRADARLARQWWPGVTGGTLAGTVNYVGGRLRANATVTDGSLDFLGEAVSGVRGDIAYQESVVSANLSGTALGGAVTATGGVDFAARRWFAEGNGAVTLRDAARWLAAGRLPVDVSNLPLSGSAQTQLSASGWQNFTLSGTAEGAGTLAGYALDGLKVDYGFDSADGARVGAAAAVAGGTVTASLAPRQDGFSFNLKGAGVKLSDTATADLTVALEKTPNSLGGNADAAVTGSLLGQDLQVTVGAALEPGTLQATLGGTALGSPLTGALSFRDAGVQARLELPSATLPGLKRPVGLVLSADGPANALPLALALTTPEPTGIVLGPLVVPKDIGGQLAATLRGGRLTDVSARFGTLSVAGDLGLNLADGALTYSLKNTPLSGVVNGEASVADGVLTLNGGVLAGRAQVTSSALRLPGVTLPPLVGAALSFERETAWHAALTAPDSSLALVYDGSNLRATTADYEVTVAGQNLSLTGTSDLTLQNPLGSLEVALKAATPLGDVALAGGAEALRFDLAPTFGAESRLTGTLSLLERAVTVNGQLGALSVTGAASSDAENVTGTVNIQGGGERLELGLSGSLARPSLALSGQLPLNLVGDLFSVKASGTLRADLARSGDGYRGSAEVTGAVAAVPVDLRVTGDGDSLGITGDVTPLSVPVNLSGRLRPTLELNATSEVGSVTLDGAGLTGAGTVPGGSFAGFTLAPQIWTLAGSLPEGAAELSLPETDSRLRLERSAAGWAAAFDLTQTLERGDGTVTLAASGDLTPTGSTLNGALSARTPAGDATLPVTGSLAGLKLSGNLPAAVAASLFGAPLAVKGDLSVAASAQLSGGLDYAATLAWQTPGGALSARLERADAGFSVTATGDGLDLRYSPEALTLVAETFKVGPFFEAVQGNLTGSLSRTSAGWDGALTLDMSAPVALRALVNGAGERLELRADYAANGVSAHADGNLLPGLDLELSGAFRELATLQGRAGGTLARPELAATLTTRPLDLQGGKVNVPAQTASLTADLVGGVNARAHGDALDLKLTREGLQGRLELPFTVANEPHLLSADIGGSLAHPILNGGLVGNLASGPVTVADDRLATTLHINPSPLVPGLPLVAPEVTVSFEGARDLTWQAQIGGAAQVRGVPSTFDGTLSGEGARYRGEAIANLAGERVPLTVTGQGGSLQAQATFETFDLASLAPALPLSLSGTLQGGATLDTTAPHLISFDLTTAGAVQGRAFDLRAKREDGDPLNVTGAIEGTSVSLQSDAGAYAFNLGSGDGPLSLAGRLETAPTLRLDVSGRYLSQPVTATGMATLNAATSDTVSWSAAVGDATVQGSAARDDKGWTVQSAAQSPENGPLPFAGRAEVAARVEDGNVVLQTLTANTTLAERAVALELSGPAWPTPDLTGAVEVAGFGRGDLRATARGAASGYRVSLKYDGLDLNAALTAGLALEALALEGAGTLPVGPHVALTSDLGWTAAKGFSGKAVADLGFGDLGANLTAVGSGPLGVAGRAVYRGQEQRQEVARLELALSDNPLARPGVNGRLTVQGDLGRLWPAYRTLASAPTTLSGSLDISGEVTRPRLDGPVTAQGALDAAGTFVWDGAAGRLTLSGVGLDAAAEVDAAGWRVSAQADGLELGSLLPQLDAPRLDARLNGGGTWGEPPNLQVGDLKLQTPNGSLAGTLEYDGVLSGRLETNLALSDLNLGAALAGRLTGNLLLNRTADGANLTGTLQANALGLAGQGAKLDGDLIVRGPLLAPDLTLNLRGTGAASGALSARLAPGQNSYAVTSTLNIGALASDFAVSLGAGNLEAGNSGTGNLSDAAVIASGRLTYRDYAVAVGVGPETNAKVVRLTGRERLEGWQLDLAAANSGAARLDLRGPLAGLNDALAGSVALSAVRPSADGSWLSGTLSDLAVGPVAVGDVAVGSSGGTLTLGGDALAATVSLQGGLAWNLERLGVDLPGELALEVAGRGTVRSASLSASIGGAVQGASFEVPAALAYREGTVTVTSDAELLGGQLSLNAQGSAAGWQGGLEVANARLSGVTANLSGDLSGPLQAPELAAALRLGLTASPATAFTGDLLASPTSQSLTGDLTSPLLGASLRVAGTLSDAPELTLQSDADILTLKTEDGLLTAAGALELNAGPVQLEVAAPAEADAEDALTLRVSVPRLSGLVLTSALPRVSPAALPTALAEGLVWHGSQNTEGSVVLRLGADLSADLRALSFDTPDGRLELSGRVAPGAGQLSGRWQGDTGTTAGTLPWLAALRSVSFEADLSDGALGVSAAGAGSRLAARYDLGTRRGDLNAALELPTGKAAADLSYDAALGPNGAVSFEAFPVFSSPATGDARLNAALTLTPEALSGTANLGLGDGSLALSGSLGLASVLPSALVPEGTSDQNISANFGAFDLENVPWVARSLPYLTAPLTGEAALRGNDLSARLTAPLTVAGRGADGSAATAADGAAATVKDEAARVLPLTLTLGGTLANPEAQGEVGRSSFTLSRAGGTVAGLVRFVDFPLDQAAAAVAGPSAVSAQLTGALRFEVPGGSLPDSYIRFSSERLVLEEGGVVTEGDLSFELENGALSVQKASFEGVGSWQASGVASRKRLDLRFDAFEADFSPLLRLVPQFAGLNLSAFGSVQLVTSGSLLNPVVKANVPELKLGLGGSAYRVSDTSLTVQNSDFVMSGRVDGVAPLTGSLAFGGGGQVKLAAPRSFDLSLRFAGNPEVPVLGTLENVAGTVSVQPGENWRLTTTGVLGSPFELSGSLSPLDLRLTGQNLNLRAPRYFLSSSATDADLHFFRDDRFHLGGSLVARQATLALEGRQKEAAAKPGAAAAVATPTPETPALETPAPETAPPDAPRSPNAFAQRLAFDDLSIKAPQQIAFSENFGSGELGEVDLVLGGTAAKPTLSGSARALRGTVRFAGRDFTLQTALAEFDPAQGVYPALNIAATTSFDKLQVLSGLADQVSFVEPREGADFSVTLTLSGGIEPSPDGPKPFKVNITPSLSSDAVIDLGTETRPLSEAELFSLLTLGKLELSPEFAQGSLATSLAQGALDTAVDFLILSELQRGLGDALGLDLLEIRTTPLGSLLTGDSGAFGVSLRLGGYLSDEVFASFEIGSLNLGADVSLRNQFDVRYNLGALEFNLAGRLDFFRNAGLEPLPEIDLNLGYAFSPLVRLETGLALSTAKQGVRFGVSLRW